MSEHIHTHDHRRHGLPPPPEGLFGMRVRAAADDLVSPMPIHHWEQGPLDVEPVARPYRLRLRDGTRVTITHRKYWYLGRVEGMPRVAALRAIYGVLLAPRSWSRAGVHFARTMSPDRATALVEVVPDGQTVCGSGAAGCYSWGAGTPRAQVEAEYVGNPDAMSVILGMELCGHGTFRMLDMYNAVHSGYEGVMGTWESCRRAGWFPVAHEIESGRRWLRGEIPAALVHDD